jgi:HD superfamily phosphohydrolase YqeK
MNKLDRLQAYVTDIFNEIPDRAEREDAYLHTFGVADKCALLAKKRGLDPLLARACGMMHDLYAYKTGVRPLHAVNGAEMARVAFKRYLSGEFTPEEEMLIRSAIFHHSDKEHRHDPYDELLKDADVLQHDQYDGTDENRRLTRLQQEFGLPVTADAPAKEKKKPAFSREAFAAVAGHLAAKPVRGVREDEEYRAIVCRFPVRKPLTN